MERFFRGAIFVALFTVGLGTAFATASLELVSGSSTLYVSDNGAVTCLGPACATAVWPAADANLLPGAVSLAGVTFGGFTLTITTGGSNSPGCDGLNGPGCLNTTNITATNISSGTATLTMYFADTGFTPLDASGLTVGFSTPGEDGRMATQTAYATAGTINPLASGNLNPTVGLTTCGTAPLTILGPTLNFSVGTACATPGTPFSLELATTMTAGVGQAFNLNGTISAVPEPAAVVLFGTVLAICASGLRRRRRLS